MPKRILQGVVVGDKCDKMVVVKVERRLMHKKYKKIIAISKKYAAHDEENAYKVGDSVRIIETPPISKRKRWKVIEGDGDQKKQAAKKPAAAKTEEKKAEPKKADAKDKSDK